MRELLNLLAQNDAVRKQTPLETKNIIDNQKHLVKAGWPMLPKAFIDFLKVYNGVKSDGGAVLGISPFDHTLDIVDINTQFNKTNHQIILGYDDFAFLVYDDVKKKYFLTDRSDGLELDDFLEDEFSSALSSVLHF